MVYDGEALTPIKDAEVTIDLESKYTEPSGIILFTLPNGKYDVYVVKQGYYAQSTSVDVLDANQTVILYLEPVAIQPLPFIGITITHIFAIGCIVIGGLVVGLFIKRWVK